MRTSPLKDRFADKGAISVGGAMAFAIKLTNFARGATGATRSLETTGAAAL